MLQFVDEPLDGPTCLEEDLLQCGALIIWGTYASAQLMFAGTPLLARAMG
jgi:hypothetical protein